MSNNNNDNNEETMNDQKIIVSSSFLSRRRILHQSFPLSFLSIFSFNRGSSPSLAITTTSSYDDEYYYYYSKLGSGSFKDVYDVFLVTKDGKSTNTHNAMSVERLRYKRNVREAIRSIHIVEQIQQQLSQSSNNNDTTTTTTNADYFEQVLQWWIQPLPPNSFVPNEPINKKNGSSNIQKIQSMPTKQFLGSLYLLSFKPVYDMDLKRFMKQTPCQYTILEDEPKTTTITKNNNNNNEIVAGITLTNIGAINLAIDLCRIGRILQDELYIVHRDIKPKNIMITNHHAVLIDFGFADFVQRPNKKGRYCIEEPPFVKGEVEYVLADDVKNYRGCQEGDRYAMGKTLYELLFRYYESANHPQSDDDNKNDGLIVKEEEKSSRIELTEEEARIQNEKFQTILQQESPSLSRFQLSTNMRDVLLQVIHGLCSYPNTLSLSTFQKAEEFLLYQRQTLLLHEVS